jgi:hypothetical protein
VASTLTPTATTSTKFETSQQNSLGTQIREYMLGWEQEDGKKQQTNKETNKKPKNKRTNKQTNMQINNENSLGTQTREYMLGWEQEKGKKN